MKRQEDIPWHERRRGQFLKQRNGAATFSGGYWDGHKRQMARAAIINELIKVHGSYRKLR